MTNREKAINIARGFLRAHPASRAAIAKHRIAGGPDEHDDDAYFVASRSVLHDCWQEVVSVSRFGIEAVPARLEIDGRPVSVDWPWEEITATVADLLPPRTVSVSLDAATLAAIEEIGTNDLIVQAKLADEGVVVDVVNTSDNRVIATGWRLYAELGVVVRDATESDASAIVLRRRGDDLATAVDGLLDYLPPIPAGEAGDADVQFAKRAVAAWRDGEGTVDPTFVPETQADIVAHVARLSRRALECIVLDAYLGLYQTEEGDLDPDQSVSGADFVERVASTLESNGLSAPSV